MNEQLSMFRLGHLLRGELVNRYRSLLVICGTLAALMLAHGMLTAAFDTTPINLFALWGGGMLFIWGPIAASRSFTELHDKAHNEAFLLLPASALEKVLARLVLATIGFAALVIVFTNVISWLNAGFAFVLFGRRDMLFPTFGASAAMLAFFLVQQSMFLLGAAWFRKNHLVKTALVLTVGTIGLALFAGFVVRLFFPEVADPFASGLMQRELGGFLDAYGSSLKALQIGLTLLYFVVVPIVCWVLAWMRLTETQVSHGV
jgi:hypothetical protein